MRVELRNPEKELLQTDFYRDLLSIPDDELELRVGQYMESPDGVRLVLKMTVKLLVMLVKRQLSQRAMM